MSLIALITFLGSSCSKETVNQSIPKPSIVGTWLFDVHRYEVNTDSIGFMLHDSISYQGNIKYKTIPDIVQICYTSEDSIVLNVDSVGVLSNFPTNYCSGQFFPNDSIYVYLKWGGLGGGITHEICGQKLIN